jgi:hypothetical protein
MQTFEMPKDKTKQTFEEKAGATSQDWVMSPRNREAHRIAYQLAVQEQQSQEKAENASRQDSVGPTKLER